MIKVKKFQKYFNRLHKLFIFGINSLSLYGEIKQLLADE